MEEETTPEIEYPISFPLKVIGLDEADFEAFVVEIVRRHVPDLLEENIISHFSTQSKYRSVSMEFIADSREQLDALYAELGAHPRILMIL
jgi:putative lipoic acid-binding regulatory protein